MSTFYTPTPRLDVTTGSLIINDVKFGAQLESPNQMIEMTIQTKTDVEFSTERKSWITPRAVRERNDARPASGATTTAPPKPTRIRPSEASVWRQISPVATMSTKPRATASGEGRT